MNSKASILLITILFFSGNVFSDTWTAQLGYVSGWGDEFGLIVSANETLAKAKTFGPEGSEICKNYLVPKKSIDSISNLIQNVPASIPDQSLVKILNPCADERNHALLVTTTERTMFFQYAIGNEDSMCRKAGGEVPKWMSELVNEVESVTSELQCSI